MLIWVRHTCPCCGSSAPPVAYPYELAETLAARGDLTLDDPHSACVRWVCVLCLLIAAAGDSAACGVDMPLSFYNAMAREV